MFVSLCVCTHFRYPDSEGVSYFVPKRVLNYSSTWRHDSTLLRERSLRCCATRVRPATAFGTHTHTHTHFTAAQGDQRCVYVFILRTRWVRSRRPILRSFGPRGMRGARWRRSSRVLLPLPSGDAVCATAPRWPAAWARTRAYLCVCDTPLFNATGSRARVFVAVVSRAWSRLPRVARHIATPDLESFIVVLFDFITRYPDVYARCYQLILCWNLKVPAAAELVWMVQGSCPMLLPVAVIKTNYPCLYSISQS